MGLRRDRSVTVTLEQELDALIQNEDYQVVIAHVSDNYLKLRIVYLPRLTVQGEGAFRYIASGLVAEQHFIVRNPARRWRKAKRWALAEITGHREFITGVGRA